MAAHNGSGDPEEEPPGYLVEFTEPAQAEADTAYLWFSEHEGPEYALRWYEGLFETAQTLATMPRAHAVSPENDRYDVEVRRLIYHGPSGRRSGNAYRLLFYIIEPEEGEDEGIVRILHIWHGARGPLP